MKMSRLRGLFGMRSALVRKSFASVGEIDFALRSQQASILQTFDHIVFRLLLPFALGL